MEYELAILRRALSLMADQLIHHQNEYNELELEGGGYVVESKGQTVLRYTEQATKELCEEYLRKM